jgi:4-hydroxy-3-methylbut-2-enyl diphosphate reductase
MLSSESFSIGEMFRAAILARDGADAAAGHFRAFDTICSATQDRQDAVIRLLGDERLDLMVVIGGYNSSNTCNLARICADSIPTFHIADPDGLVSADLVRHRDVTTKQEISTTGWLPAEGPLRVGITSGASTPDNLVEQTILALDRYATGPRNPS